MSRLSIATKSRLPSSLRVESSNTAVIKTISRLSREALILLALDWLDGQSLAFTAPYLSPPRADDDNDNNNNNSNAVSNAAAPDDATDLYPPCQSIEELRDLYTDLQDQRGSRRDVVSRILEGDWRHGLTLYQLAMIDFTYLDEHPTSQKWTAYKIQPLMLPDKNVDEDVVRVNEKSLSLPRFHPSTFLQSLQEQVLPDIKAHYHFFRPKKFPLLLLRIFAIESPYNTELALSGLNASGNTTNFSSSRTIYLAFPHGSPALYITRPQTTGPISHGESKSLQSLIANGVPQALSRPRERYTLKPTSLVSRNLEAILDKRGSGRSNAAGGGWSIYANEKDKKSPLDSILPTPPLSRESSLADGGRGGQKRQRPLSQHQRAAKRAKTVAKARFGDSAIMTDGKGIEKLDIIMQDSFPPIDGVYMQDSEDEDDRINRRADRRKSKMDTALRHALGDRTADDDDDDDDDARDSRRWRPLIRINFQGPHVFAGIRQLVEAGIVDGERMPGWMTGEDAVTTGVVRNGLIRGHKGSGL